MQQRPDKSALRFLFYMWLIMGIKFSTLHNIQVSLLNEFLFGFSEITWLQVQKHSLPSANYRHAVMYCGSACQIHQEITHCGVASCNNCRHMGIMWLSVAKKSAVNLKVKHGKGTHHKPRLKNDSIWTFGRFLTAFQDIE